MRYRPALVVAVAAVVAVPLLAGALERAAVPAPQPAPNASFDYGSGSFADEEDCESYRPGGENADGSWPSGAIHAAEVACCQQTKNEFNSSKPKMGLRCQPSQATVACNGAKCDS